MIGRRVIYEVSADGLQAGETVTVEVDHDPAAVDLILRAAPTRQRGGWASFVEGWNEGRARRLAAPARPPAPLVTF